MESAVLTSNPLLLQPKSRSGKQSDLLRDRDKKVAQRIVNKLNHVKNAMLLIACEFDERLMQLPGFLGSLTPKLESSRRSSNFSGQPFKCQFPPLVRPLSTGQNGMNGEVPLPNSITWTRYKPQLNDENAGAVADTISFIPDSESEVLFLLTVEQLRSFWKTRSSTDSDMPYPSLDAFEAAVKDLGRPTTCVLIVDNKLQQLLRKPILSPLGDSTLSISQLCVRWQLSCGVQATRICSSVEEAALLVASYTQSVAERPFKEGRLSRDEGFNFLPNSVRMGLAGCASRGRGAGPAPNPPAALTTSSIDQLATKAWASRVWLSQLGQWRGLTGEIAHSISLAYPTSRAFYDACFASASDEIAQDSSECRKRKCSFESTLADLEIRRGAGVLATRRRLGPEFARRLVAYFTSDNPDCVVD